MFLPISNLVMYLRSEQNFKVGSSAVLLRPIISLLLSRPHGRNPFASASKRCVLSKNSDLRVKLPCSQSKSGPRIALVVTDPKSEVIRIYFRVLDLDKCASAFSPFILVICCFETSPTAAFEESPSFTYSSSSVLLSSAFWCHTFLFLTLVSLFQPLVALPRYHKIDGKSKQTFRLLRGAYLLAPFMACVRMQADNYFKSAC